MPCRYRGTSTQLLSGGRALIRDHALLITALEFALKQLTSNLQSTNCNQAVSKACRVLYGVTNLEHFIKWFCRRFMEERLSDFSLSQ